ncbi:MAG: hypothetical protein ACE5IL_09795 [Myxococcota bacterium]
MERARASGLRRLWARLDDPRWLFARVLVEAALVVAVVLASGGGAAIVYGNF